MAAREIRTPIDREQVVDLGNGVYRKQVLPHRTINYQGRQLTFDRAYCDDVAQSFRDQAFDTVPFVLADEDNRHTMAPERARGEVLGLESADDGLYATVRLSDDAQRLVEDNPKFGVSVRLKEDYERPDGVGFKRACQHVLGTWDPKITGLSPWAPVDLSADPEAELIDLTNDDQEGADMADQIPGWFQQLVDSGAITVNDPDAFGQGANDVDDQATDTDAGGDAGQVEDLDEIEGETDGMSDEAFDAWANELLEGDDDTGDGDTAGDHDDVDQYAEVAASADDDGALEFSGGYDEHAVELAQERAENATLRREVYSERYEREAVDLSQRLGIPPFIVEAARPLLEGPGQTVDLSNGDGEVNAGQVMRDVLDKVGHTFKMLDLSESQGNLLIPDGSEDEEATQHRSQRAGQIVKFAGLA